MNSLNPEHPMTQVAQDNILKLLACVIWKLRKHCPNLAVEITHADMEQLANVFMNNGQRGIVAIKGKPAGIEIQLVDQETGERLKQDPTMDANSPNAKMMKRVLEARGRAQGLADQLLDHASKGKFDIDLNREAAGVLKLLVWEPK